MAVTVQLPLAGNPLKTTLPVATLQVGWVMDPNVGAAGVGGCALTTAEEEAEETQLAAFSTTNV